MTASFARAAVVSKYGDPITIERVPIPEDIEPGALLVKVLACSVCGTDVHGWQGELTITADLPSIPGHEMVGEIVAVGADSDRDSFGDALSIGDRVIWTHASCGGCPGCADHRDSALCDAPRMYGYLPVDESPYLLGGFSEFAYVLPGSGRVRVPDDVTDELASVAACAVRSAAKAVDAVGATSPGDVVLVQGSGPVGLFATAMLALRPHSRLVVVGAPDDRLRLAAEFGATDTISIDEFPTPASRHYAVLDATGGVRPTTVLEMSGGRTAFGEGLELIARGGRYVLMGQVGSAEVTSVASRITMRNLTVQGAFSGSVRYYKEALDFLQRNHTSIPFHEMISGRYALEDVDLVMNRMLAHEEVKPVMFPWGREPA